MELKLQNGDYVLDGAARLCRVEGDEALLQRVLFRLSARRGAFPFWGTLGSQLWQLGGFPPPPGCRPPDSMWRRRWPRNRDSL